jgi:hypothetical protein
MTRVTSPLPGCTRQGASGLIRALVLLFAGMTGCSVAERREEPPAIVVGRTIDVAGRPCGGIRVQVNEHSPYGTVGWICETDAEGRFRCVVRCEDGTDICLDLPVDAEGVPQHHADIAVQAGYTYELGDLRLDGRNFLMRLDDDEAERWLRSEASRYTSHWFEPLLNELLRRSKMRWIPVLEQVLPTASAEASLPVLTTLRRLQGKPDPVRVMTAVQPMVIEWPGNESLAVRAMNVDVDGAAFEVGPCVMDVWHVEIRDAAGRRLPATSQRSVAIFVGLAPCIVVAPHEDQKGVADLLDSVELLEPGQYSLRVLYHGSDASGWPWLRDGLVMSASAEIPVQVVKRRISTTHEEQERLATSFAAIATEPPSALDDVAFHAWLDSVRAAKEIIAGAGWRSVPLLLTLIEDERESQDARCRAVAALQGISGIGSDWEAEPRNPAALAVAVGRWRSWRHNLEIEVR